MYAAPLTSPQIYPVNSRQLQTAEDTMPLVANGYANGFGTGVSGLGTCGGGGCNSGSKCGCGCSGGGMGDLMEDVAPFTSLAVHLGMVVFAVAAFKMFFGGRRVAARAKARARKRN